MNPNLLSTSESAVLLGISVSGLYRSLNRAKERGLFVPKPLRAYGVAFYNREDLLKFAAQGGVRHAA